MLPRRCFSATLVLPWHQQLQQRDGACAGRAGYDRTEDNMDPVIHYCEEACTRCLAAEQDTKRKARARRGRERFSLTLHGRAPHLPAAA